MKKETLFAIGLLVLAILTRFLPHPPNFTPILAMALFAGSVFKNKSLAYIMPIAVMFITDLFLGLHESLWAVYASLGAIIFIGTKLKDDNALGIFASALGSSVLFFLVTNFSVWAFTPYYTKDLAGLISSYTLALPFFKWNVLSTLLYSGVLFGAYYVASNFITDSQKDMKPDPIKIDE